MREITTRMQVLFTAAAVILCLGAFGSSASAYSLSSRGCVGSGGGVVTKGIADWNNANIVMPARNISRAPGSCSTYGTQRIVVQYQLWSKGYYDYRYELRYAPVYEGFASPGGHLSMSTVGWGQSIEGGSTVASATPYRTLVRVWWERPSNRAVYGYKSYYSNSNGDYACGTISTINGDAWCGIANGAISQIPGIWLQ